MRCDMGFSEGFLCGIRGGRYGEIQRAIVL